MSARRASTDEAIVLARFPYGESSLVVHLLTRRHGRVHLLAKGAFRPTSGYFAALDLFDTVEVRWLASPGLGLATCSRASVVVSRRRLARDLERYSAAEAVLALTGLGAREDAADVPLFRLASATLDALGLQQPEPRVVRLAFEFSFLATMGVGIALAACARCGARPDASARTGVPFSFADGGRLCARCRAATTARVVLIGADLLAIAERLVAAPTRTLGNLRLSEAQAGGLDRLAASFLAWHLEPGTRTARALAARVGSDVVDR